MNRVLLDRYELEDVIGAGGMAQIRLATDRVLDRKVAVKVLDDVAARSADPAARNRFLNEARSAASFSHPNAVAVYDAGEDDGVLFIVLELVRGESLAARMARENPLPVAEAIRIATQVLDALDAMHRAGVVHRDVKPANVLLDRNDQVKLTDFGIAKRLDEIDEALTSDGTVIGTPQYLAPEQAVGDTLGPRTDVYLVGAVLHEMLTGQRPPSVLAGVPRRPPAPSALRDGILAELDRVVVRSLAHRADDRFGSAADMATALRALATADDETSAATTIMPITSTVATTAELPQTDDLHPTDEVTVVPVDLEATTAEVPVESVDLEATTAEVPVEPVDLEATTAEAPADSSDPEATTAHARLDSVRGEPTRRRWRHWIAAGVIAVACAGLIGLAIRAADDNGAPSTLPAPVDGEEFLVALRADPDRFGSKGDELLDELEGVLAETDRERRDEATEQLQIDIFVWVAEGDLDTVVGELVDDLLRRRAP